MLGSEVFIYSSTIIAPLSFNFSPASFAIVVSGLTPIDRIIISPYISFPLFKITFLPLFLNSSTPSFKIKSTPLSIKWPCIMLAISISNGPITWLLPSTKVTLTPFSWRFSAISRPINPPPITIALFGFSSSKKLFILSISGMFLRVKRVLQSSIPAIGGFIGFAPGDKTRVS